MTRKIDAKMIKHLFVNNVTLCVIISGTIFHALIFNLDKYQAELIATGESSGNYLYYYEDLENDGNSERIEYIMDHPQLTGLLVYKNGKTVDQWNFKGKWANTISPFISDYDQDGSKEIFVFSMHNDSIFMHCVDVMNRKVEIENKAICKTWKDRGGEYDFLIYPCTAYDVNNDGFKELFFSIGTAFSTIPRNMFAYYHKKNSVMVSPESCSLVLFPEMFDFEGDNIPEFMGSITHACGNCELERKYTDQYNWLMVFDPEMKFKFPPIRLNAHPAVSRFIPFNTGKNKYILVWHYYEGTQNFQSFMALFDVNGNLIRKKLIDKNKNMYFCPLFSRDKKNTEVFLLQTNGDIMSIDSNLNMHHEAKFDSNIKSYRIQKKDIDCDGQDEFIIPGKNKTELIIYRNNFADPVSLKLQEDATNGQMSIIKEVSSLPKIFLDTQAHQYTFRYEKTLLYKYRYAIFIPILILLLSFFYIIRQLKKYKKLKAYNLQKQISELQIKSIQNQLDPHFTFNIFASFANLINEKDTERANYIFDKYAGLLKASILNSENIHISLQEELDFVASFLELEKFRYSSKFSFQINMQENIDTQILVPKMILHIFIENAIKHGLKHLNSGGELSINGTKKNGLIHISIKDNGIGRVKAKEMGLFSTGKGLGIIDQIIEFYYKLYNLKISYQIVDLYENDKATGTEVKIMVPDSNFKVMASKSNY
jgi:hypothetical protein